ncbi:MAG TPA: CoA transferase [Mycobacteriales bacterium]|nr:CoA transferase [Mycobacteriales bacterium]
MAGLLDGLRVVDLSDGSPEHAGHVAGRVLADLGADVVLVEPPGGVALRAEPLRFLAWSAGKRSVVAEPDDDRLAALLRAADVVLATRAPHNGEAPRAAWVAVTAYGLSGPYAEWRGSDLTLSASAAGLYPTGDPDRPPVRCSEGVTAAHGGPEIAVAALTAVASGVPQVVDVSLQETLLLAVMGGPARFPLEHNRGTRRGAFTGRTQESWACKDGWVSFGLRGGPTRVRNLQALTKLCVEDGVATPALTDRDWTAYDHRSISDDELAEITKAVQAYFDRHTMAELYDVAVRTGLMLAPANSPREIADSEQLAARGFYRQLADVPKAPDRFVVAGPEPGLVECRGDAPALGAGPWPNWLCEDVDTAGGAQPLTTGEGNGVWAGLRIVELGSGAAGPLATGYFADHGATVIRIEAPNRPDFLRSYTTIRGNPDGSAFFAVLNAGKLDVALDLKDPAQLDVARRLIATADVVAENFAPGAMDRLGLGADVVRELNPTAVRLSACLNGQTGPHRDFPGFGGQGAALSGYTFLTGWPDRAPVGPAGTITDSLAPRFGAACLAAALAHRRRTGQGVDLDLSQVEAAIWTLSPWLMAYTRDGVIGERVGNDRPGACPHGAFPAAGKDCWVAIAVWDDDDWSRLCEVVGNRPAGLDTAADRAAHPDEVAAFVTDWTSRLDPADAASALQAGGVEAAPVHDWESVLSDPQLVAREHFVKLPHPVLGDHVYEQRGFRLTTTPGRPRAAGPLLGQHNHQVLTDVLGMSDAEMTALTATDPVRTTT